MPACQLAARPALARPNQAISQHACEPSPRGGRTALPVSVYFGRGGAQSGPRIRLVLRDKSVFAEPSGPARPNPEIGTPDSVMKQQVDNDKHDRRDAEQPT